jgi:hypothetical protein
MIIPRKSLSANERADLARLLFKAGHAVRPARFRETRSGPYTYGVELPDAKNAAPGGNDTEGGKTK